MEYNTGDVVVSGEVIYRYFAVPGRPGSVAQPLLAFSTDSVYTWPVHSDIMPGNGELFGLIIDKIWRLVFEVKRLMFSHHIGVIDIVLIQDVLG